MKLKKFLSVILCIVLAVGIIPLATHSVKAETETGKKITEYAVGDTFEFGYYPQSKVTDDTTIAALNELAKVDNTSAETITTSTSVASGWISYGYYSGTGIWDDGQMVASDYMRYTDVILGSNKYRGVIFDSYRPYYTGSTSSTYQDDNGYSTGTVYWFKYEPITWRVLDPSTGLVMSETILDSQEYNSYILNSGTDEYGYTASWGDSAKTYYANNYAESSIRKWLNDDFYNTAFSASQKNMIATTELNNSAYSTSYSEYNSATTSDKIYLLSYADILKTSYGFDSLILQSATRTAQGSDYAKSQGLWVSTDSDYSGNSYWRLRSAGYNSKYTCCVEYSGYVSNGFRTDPQTGICPAMNFDTNVEIVQKPLDKEKIGDYSVGDTFEYGYYPQSKVTDEATITSLNTLAKVDNTSAETITASTSVASGWTSYGYYSGTGTWDDGQMVASDYMRYTDVILGSNKYRGVIFDSYRPSHTGYEHDDGTYQDDNGYNTGNVYWFKYEPITWRVLDPSTGMVMSETILDSQAYNNYILSSGTDEYGYTVYWGNSAKEYYANNYAESSIRKWLNDDFYNTAFSASQKNMIATTELDNSAYDTSYSRYDSATTNDKIYLLSYADALNTSYGFSSSRGESDTAKRAQGSDYAKSQGLRGGIYNGNSYWRLRSAGSNSYYTCDVDYDGYVHYSYYTFNTSLGVRPALNFNPTSVISQSKVSEVGNANYTVETYTMNASGTYEKTSENVLTGNYKSTVKAEYTVPMGFTLNETNSVLSGTVKADGSLVLKVYLDRNKYTLTTVVDEVSTPTEYYYGQAITVSDPTKTGYSFTGWTPEIPATMPANALTVTAQFTENSNYTVKFDTDGADTKDDKTSVKWTDKVLNGITDPVKTGYTFNGWYVGINPVSADSTYGSLVANDEVMSVEIVARWVAKDGYTVKFDTDGGNTVADKTNVKWTDKVLDGIADPVKAGYTFYKWISGSNSGGIWIGGYVNSDTTYGNLAKDDTLMTVTVKADWEENSNYTVKFDTDGGDAKDDKTGVKWTDNVLAGVTDPVKAGYTFNGWYVGDKEVATDTAYSALVANDTVSEITLKAKWTAKKYTVKFDTDGGSAITDKTLEWNDKVLDGITDPVKAGYTFYKWISGSNSGGIWIGGYVNSDTTYGDLAKDDTLMTVTVKANWEENSDYTVTFNTDGGDAKDDKTGVKWTDNVLAGVTDPVKTGYSFVGWYVGINPVSADSTYGSLVPNDKEMSVEIVARWLVKDGYTVTFDTDGGNTVADKTNVKWTDKVLEGVVPVKAGYTFDGWFVGETEVNVNAFYSELAENDKVTEITLKAKWTANDYTVKFDTDGGTELEDKIVKWYDTVLTNVATPEKAGCTFEGWYYGETKVTDSVTYGELVGDDTMTEITVKAKWTENVYTVKFDTDGGSHVGDNTVKWGGFVLSGNPVPQKHGYTFDGWYYLNTPVDSTGIYGVLVANDTVSEITLKAKWTAKDYTVKFDTNGGNELEDKIIKWYDTVLTNVATPEKAGFTFEGWYYGETEVTADNAYSELVENDSITPIILKAAWRENKYTIEFDTDGAAAIASKENVSWYTVALDGVDTPEKSGFIFNGWYYGETKVEADAKYCDLAADDTVTSITIKAKWTDIEKPVISGIDNGATYCEGKTFTVSDNGGIASVSANGVGLVPDANGNYTLEAANGEVVVVVTDLEGNSATMTVTVNEHNYSIGECTECGAQDPDACCLLKILRYIINWLTAFIKSCIKWIKEMPISLSEWFKAVFGAFC